MNTFEMSSKKAKSFFTVAAMTLSAIQFACASEPAKKLPEKTSIPGKQIEKKLTGSQQKLLESLRTRWGKSPEEIMKFKPQAGGLQKVAHIDPSSITVSGLSSGGFMSTQLHFQIFSKGLLQLRGGRLTVRYKTPMSKPSKSSVCWVWPRKKGMPIFTHKRSRCFLKGRLQI